MKRNFNLYNNCGRCPIGVRFNVGVNVGVKVGFNVGFKVGFYLPFHPGGGRLFITRSFTKPLTNYIRLMEAEDILLFLLKKNLSMPSVI